MTTYGGPSFLSNLASRRTESRTRADGRVAFLAFVRDAIMKSSDRPSVVRTVDWAQSRCRQGGDFLAGWNAAADELRAAALKAASPHDLREAIARIEQGGPANAIAAAPAAPVHRQT